MGRIGEEAQLERDRLRSPLAGDARNRYAAGENHPWPERLEQIGHSLLRLLESDATWLLTARPSAGSVAASSNRLRPRPQRLRYPHRPGSAGHLLRRQQPAGPDLARGVPRAADGYLDHDLADTLLPMLDVRPSLVVPLLAAASQSAHWWWATGADLSTNCLSKSCKPSVSTWALRCKAPTCATLPGTSPKRWPRSTGSLSPSRPAWTSRKSSNARWPASTRSWT